MRVVPGVLPRPVEQCVSAGGREANNIRCWICALLAVRRIFELVGEDDGGPKVSLSPGQSCRDDLLGSGPGQQLRARHYWKGQLHISSSAKKTITTSSGVQQASTERSCAT
jgi:hypothetical protein